MKRNLKVIQFANGYFGIKEFYNNRWNTIAAGMTKRAANQWMDRLQLRAVWGK